VVATTVSVQCADNGFRGIDSYDGPKTRLLKSLLAHSRWVHCKAFAPPILL